ncbi:pyridoxal phosphate-dependent transferase [Diplogelasinospora grovesii]|uniref:Pyridoxal phosphate-dependent transferase n=1 Tax=Diplogelasinospora grovesii TaxID=303347 RepID=A0AAN6NHA4_9PEZI|nr:pyridoxal phosphate-dependent transferase [Diplogelasinospora grovesii]
MVLLTRVDSGSSIGVNGNMRAETKSAVFHRHLNRDFLPLAKSEGNYLILEDGREVFDASGGAAVGCIGWGNKQVAGAIMKQVLDAPYCASIYYTTRVQEELCRALVDSTSGKMARAYIVNSGSEAMEAALKLARQYFVELKPSQPQRTRFIARNQSYHGTTLGALAIGGHQYRRSNFEPLLMKNASKVSPCFAFRGKFPGETDEDYVNRLAKELDDEFQRVGPETVCAFVAEPVVGAALGCVPAVPGYFKAVRAVCQKYGALLILDEVMCGMGRTGTLHAWEQEGVVPDIQTIGKALGGGYQPVAGVLANPRVINVIRDGTSAFVHGHTYQGQPTSCAAALEVQRIIREEGLLSNVREMGTLLSELLKTRLGDHPNVGDIRGRGLFWGIEFVADKQNLTPFPVDAHVAMEISELGLTEEYSISVYPGAGSADGIRGDHIIIAPAYNVTSKEIEMIVATFGRLVDDFFANGKFAS